MKFKKFAIVFLLGVVIGFSLRFFRRSGTVAADHNSPAPMAAGVSAPPAASVEPPKLAVVAPASDNSNAVPTPAPPLTMDDPVAIDARIADVINNLQKNAPLSPRLQTQLDALLAVRGESPVIDAGGNSGRYDPVFVDDQQVQVILIKRNGGWAVNFKVGDGLKTSPSKSSSSAATAN